MCAKVRRGVEVRSVAESLNELGNDLLAEGRFAEAEQVFARAADSDPAWSVPWYNLGLTCKRMRRWPESACANRKAVELDPSDGDAWWNLGIAATAIADWTAAREAWRACGIPTPDGDGAIDGDYGPVAVRLGAASRGEVVWCRRIDPVRAVILNVPLPESGFCEGDIVLHDAAANGHRMLQGREIPVFDVLERLEPSPRTTFTARIEAPSAADLDALRALAGSSDLRVEDWTASVRSICRACSEGVPHEHVDRANAEWAPLRHVGVSATDSAAAFELLRRWGETGDGRAVIEIEEDRRRS